MVDTETYLKSVANGASVTVMDFKGTVFVEHILLIKMFIVI